MKSDSLTSGRRYRSDLRSEQARLTRERISSAAAALLGEDGSAGSITFRAVAAAAGVTEMTVYRHFPTREDLLRGLWEHTNARMGDGIGMPSSGAQLRAQHAALFRGFDRMAPLIAASLATPEGRAMRSALNSERVVAFEAIAAEAAPGADAALRKRAAATIQLLHSAHAWASLREQWGMSGEEAAEATGWAIDALLAHLEEGKP